MDSSLLSGEKEVARPSQTIDMYPEQESHRRRREECMWTKGLLRPKSRRPRVSRCVNCALVQDFEARAASARYRFERLDRTSRSACGECKTARILTATPCMVNTPNRPVPSLTSLIYQGCGQFKRTFVLDLPGGVDIMRPNETTRKKRAGARACQTRFL